MSIRVGAALSTLEVADRAAHEAAKRAIDSIEGKSPDIAFVFFSQHHLDDLQSVIAEIAAEAPRAQLLGATTQAVIGEGQEIEEGPALSILMAHLGGASFETFEVSLEETPDGQAIVGFPLIGREAAGAVLIADPYTFPAAALLQGLGGDHPNLPIVGGMTSGAPPGKRSLIRNDRIRHHGAVGAIFGRPLEMTPVVSQGCKPIGAPLVITDAERNVVRELGGRPPVERLREIAARLGPEDQALIQKGLHIGIVIDEYNSDPTIGDFLVRAVIQANLSDGSMAIGDYVSVGQTVQFHLSDASSADEDLRRTLASRAPARPGGALVFTCNGRGRNLFDAPHHDAQAIESAWGSIPVAGMFCEGEIGPVGGRNFIHGFTSSLAVFGAGSS